MQNLGEVSRKRLVVTAVALPEKTVREMDEVAQRSGRRKRSVLIRLALDEFLARHQIKSEEEGNTVA